ncbi:sec-independent protein translocase protein TATB, chloroplastic [Amborella trichopoda]|uniref:sec-independent protein translocase protein TATB, chloroplastic n=1 Tax=Amborella trichopoda TaxID=13333 RepID=UPI0005D2E373|nr:sec-independent protein translocase protein TATB, chloroplastic [Amborella trichopoda]|eukprot:XP_011624888.1 sec-independent protein translocase protein TATB, chloroplastic [Amborella trichopoda]
MALATATSFPTFFPSKNYAQPAIILSPTLFSHPNNSKSHLFVSHPKCGGKLFTPFSGLGLLGFCSRQRFMRKDKKGKRRLRGIYASLFGVGAPEALVIGVVALLVFGPKGLAEVARNLGKTLRAFQPTIRELQDVSREFKTTLEREIGLDEVPTSMKNNGNSTSPYMNNQQPMENPSVSPTAQRPYSSEEYLKVTEEQIIASVAKQQEQTSRSQGRTEGAPTGYDIPQSKKVESNNFAED